MATIQNRSYQMGLPASSWFAKTMAVFDKIHAVIGRKGNEGDAAAAPVTITAATNEKDQEANGLPDDNSIEPVVSEDAQHGVRTAEAVTLTWGKKSLAAIFVNMWFIYLVNGFQSKITSNLTAYAASDFDAHSLIPVITVVSDIMTAAVYIPLAKILDIWGRAEGFLLMVTFATIGMAAMAGSNGLATYCAAQVFYKVGWSGLTYSIDVITADSTKLKNRGLAYAFTSSPYMITAFAGSKAAEAFLEDISWRWGFGAFTIVLPFVAAPMYILLKWNLHKAKKAGILVRQHSNRTWMEKIKWVVIEFDLAGVVLFAVGIGTFLIPFSIASSAPNGWASGYIIAMIIVGLFIVILFGLYEAYLAPVPFFKYKFLIERTVLGACLLDLVYQISYYCWVSYFTSFLQVVNNLPVSQAGYIDSTFDVVSGVLLFIVGWSIHKTGRFKWLIVAGIPLYIFAQGLMIYFRRPGQSIGYLIMCEILISIAGASFILCMQIAVLAAVDHQHVATALAILSITGNVGGAIGGTISATIWTNTFGNKLLSGLPESALDQFEAMYEDLSVQMSYPEGTPERTALQEAYGYAQTRMLAAGTGIMVLSVGSIFLVRNYNLKKMNQTKGTLF
ncbi:hypothetical protein FZEAL_6823 [Fusarium zealandicum]|uniref:Major facilitator superfamily (MFS) profile domain-containing protein n=1 Tax=Fusarium zealandicum TaxID=1053134 RepID=A0A8H4UH99_9HYPO|nr:hypothetical protein FZEAL_6823 [Fusarium zealandicum]